MKMGNLRKLNTVKKLNTGQLKKNNKVKKIDKSLVTEKTTEEFNKKSEEEVIIDLDKVINAPSKINIERGLISKLLETGDMSLINDKQIKAYYFSKDGRSVFKYLSEYYLKNGEMPTPRVFRNNFPNYELESYSEGIGTEEPLTYWCDELRTKITHNTLCDEMEKVCKLLDNLNTNDALSLIKKTIIKIENDYTETSAIVINDDAEQRKEIYKQRKENQGMIGIPMGIDKLDLILKGMQPKQLITLIAKTGVGKTWFWILIAANCILNGYKVLFFTTEMSEEQIEDRIEAMLIGKLYPSFNYNKFKSGTLSPEEEEQYFEFLDRKKNFETLVIETATGVSNVNAKIQQHNPDVIFIDGAYLMEDDRGADQDWLRVAHITRDLKKIAKNTGKPICINSQADSTTSKKTGPELENIGFSKAIGHDSDVVLSLFRDEDMIEDREMKAKVLKQREGILGNVMLNWDFSTMDFSSIYSDVKEDVTNGNSDDFVAL